MGFDADSIAVITGGLKWANGSFAERLVSSGYIGDITTGVVLVKVGSMYLLLTMQM